MTYLWKGEQYVVIAAGGHSEAGATIGDSMVAFRLPRPGEAPSLWSRTIDRPGGRFLSGAIAAAFAVWRCCSRVVALAKMAPRKLIDRSGADPSALAVPDVSFTTSVGELR